MFLPIMALGCIISLVGQICIRLGIREDSNFYRLIGFLLNLLGFLVLLALAVYSVLSMCGVIPQFIPLY